MALVIPSHRTYEKMGEVFVIHPVIEKNLSQFLKISFQFPKNGLRRRHAE
jgi:hypothetical protein